MLARMPIAWQLGLILDTKTPWQGMQHTFAYNDPRPLLENAT